MNGEAGKGDLLRPCNWGSYEETYKRLYHPKCPNCETIMDQEYPHIRNRFVCPCCGRKVVK